MALGATAGSVNCRAAYNNYGDPTLLEETMISAHACFFGRFGIGLAVVLLLYLLFTAVPVRADIVPPEQPLGSIIQPAGGLQIPVKMTFLLSETPTPTRFVTDLAPELVLTKYATMQTATALAETRVASGAASPRKTPACCACPSAGLVLAAVAMAAARQKLSLR
jgi:hypothetical protein